MNYKLIHAGQGKKDAMKLRENFLKTESKSALDIQTNNEVIEGS